MTRQAVADGFASFLDDIVAVALDEFDVVAALRGGSGSGSRLVSRLLKDQQRLNQAVIQPELQSYRSQVTTQFDLLLDYATDDAAAFSTYRDEVLEADVFWRELRTDVQGRRRERIADALIERQRQLIEAAQPLVDAEATSFWPAATASVDRDQATALVRDHFTFTDPLQEHAGAFRFTVTIDPSELFSGPLVSRLPSKTVEYTDEAVRALRTAESTVVERTLDEVDRRFA